MESKWNKKQKQEEEGEEAVGEMHTSFTRSARQEIVVLLFSTRQSTSGIIEAFFFFIQ